MSYNYSKCTQLIMYEKYRIADNIEKYTSYEV